MGQEFSTESFDISRLIFKHLQGEISVEEKLVLDEWVGRSAENKKLFEELTDKKILQSKWSKYYEIIEGSEEARSRVKLGGRLGKMKWWGLAAASVVLVVVMIFNWGDKKEKVVVAGTQEERFKNDVKAPESNRAVLTLEDGRKIYLDSVGNGTILSLANVNVQKLADGRIAYKQGAGQGAVAYNTLNNPRGSKVIDVTLADGSRVWLNNESSIKFPLAFSGNERRVIVSGEAYFEVAKDTERKFVVVANDINIEALGTQFNVNAYADEGKIITTLVEGTVRVHVEQEQETIIPGQQVLATSNSIDVNKAADLAATLGWKNGFIVFDNTRIDAILKQISRWYDVEISVERNLSKVPNMNGDLSRTMNLSDVLKILELNSGLRFVLDGKKLTVLL